MSREYIRVVHWDKFQHYKQADDDRPPAWVKSYTDLLRRDEYLDLTPHRRGLLHGLWLLYAVKRRSLRHDTRVLARELNGRVTEKDLKALADAGFIEFYSRESLEDPYSGSRLEEEREEEKKTPLAAAPRNGREPDLLWDAVAYVCGEPETKTARSLRGKVVKELREAHATPDQVMSRARGFRSMWPEMTLTDTALVKHWSTVSNGNGSRTVSCPECGVDLAGARTLEAHLRNVHSVTA